MKDCAWLLVEGPLWLPGGALKGGVFMLNILAVDPGGGALGNELAILMGGISPPPLPLAPYCWFPLNMPGWFSVLY